MSLYRSQGRGSYILERTLLGVPMRRATGIYDRERAADLEEALLKLARHGRRDLIVAFSAGQLKGSELLANVERFGLTFQLVAGTVRKERAARSSQPSRRDWVYILQRDDYTKLVKIGLSYDVSRRQAELEDASGSSLTLLVAFPGGKQDEQRLHQQFAAQRAMGEWFQPSADLMAVVGEKRLLPEAWGSLHLSTDPVP